MAETLAPDRIPPTADSRAKRNVTVLVVAQAILGAQMPIHFTLGGLSGQILSPEKCLATLPISLTVMGSMMAAPVLSSLMQRYGRRTGFVIGSLGGALGGLLAAAGLLWGSFALFLLGSFAIGIYMSAQGFYRFAAADTASAAFRPKAIAYVMAGGLIAALVAREVVQATDDLTAPVLYAGTYLAIIVLNTLGGLVFLALDIPKPPRPTKDSAGGRTHMELLRDPQIAVAMICAMVSYALMNLVMTSTPLAVVGCGYTTANASDVVTVHVLAMFAPSFVTGHLISRFGAPTIIAVGLGALALAGLVGLSGVSLGFFFVALFLLGIGWNFGFIGATALLAEAHSVEERGRVQGMNDFAVFGLVTIASLSSGLLMNCSGSDAVAGWTAVNLAMAPFLLVAGGALAWFARPGRSATP
ncbi:MAG: MFS transporter [Pseudomonadota bacterium]